MSEASVTTSIKVAWYDAPGNLFLALRAVKARPLALAYLPDGDATADAGFACLAIDV